MGGFLASHLSVSTLCLCEPSLNLINANKAGEGLADKYSAKIFVSDQMAEYLSARPSPALFALIKFRLGSHRLRVETDRWLPRKPPIGKRICRHCVMNAVENEQHFLFDRPFYTGIRQQHTVLFGPDQGSIRLFLERNADRIPLVAHYICR